MRLWVRLGLTNVSVASIKLIIRLVVIALHIFLRFIELRRSIWIARNQRWLRLLEHIRIVKPFTLASRHTTHCLVWLNQVTALGLRKWLIDLGNVMAEGRSTQHIRMRVHKVTRSHGALLTLHLDIWDKEIRIWLHLFSLHLQQILHLKVLDVLSTHVRRAAHYAAHLYPICICLYLLLILLGLMLHGPHSKQWVWIKVLSILFSMECRLIYQSVLELVTYWLMTNLCLIIPVLIQQIVSALSSRHDASLPVLASLKVLGFCHSTVHLTVKVWRNWKNLRLMPA